MGGASSRARATLSASVDPASRPSRARGSVACVTEVDFTSRRLWRTIAVVVVLATVIGLLFRANFGHFGLALLIGAPTGLAGVLCIAIGSNRAGGLCISIASCAVLSLVVGFMMRANMFRDRMAWCEAQASRLEEYKRAHGDYPARLADAVDMGDAPSWTQSQGFEYRASEGEFLFDIWDGPLSGYSWNSKERKWDRYH